MNFLSYTIGLGAVDYEMVDSAVRKKPNKARGSYKGDSDKDRFSIGKNASIYGTASTVRKWKKTYPHINESTVRGFKKRYEAQIREENRKKNLQEKSSSTNSADVLVYLEIKSIHLFRSTSKQLGIKEEL